MRVFIVGLAGATSRRLAALLEGTGHQVGGLVRQAEQADELAFRGMDAKLGDLASMPVYELAAAMAGYDVVVFSAGAGGKDGDDATTAIDGRGPGKSCDAASQVGIKRFYLVSVFPEAWRDRGMPPDFEHYMVEKKNAEVDVSGRDLDWVIVRPSALTDDRGQGTVELGAARIHTEISRDDVAATILGLIGEPRIRQVILELTGGFVPVERVVEALIRDR